MKKWADMDYRNQQAEQICAKSASELVYRLNNTARIPKSSVQVYMQTLSTMHEAQTDEPLDISSASAFIADLLERGMLVQDGMRYSVLF